MCCVAIAFSFLVPGGVFLTAEPTLRQLSNQFTVSFRCLRGGLDAQLFLQELAERFVLLLDRAAVPKRRVRAHYQAMDVFAKGVLVQNALAEINRARPLFLFVRDGGQ